MSVLSRIPTSSAKHVKMEWISWVFMDACVGQRGAKVEGGMEETCFEMKVTILCW